MWPEYVIINIYWRDKFIVSVTYFSGQYNWRHFWFLFMGRSVILFLSKCQNSLIMPNGLVGSMYLNDLVNLWIFKGSVI